MRGYSTQFKQKTLRSSYQQPKKDLYYYESGFRFFRTLRKLRSSDRFVGRDVNPCKEKALPVLNRVAMMLIINAIAMRFCLFSEKFSHGLLHALQPFHRYAIISDVQKNRKPKLL